MPAASRVAIRFNVNRIPAFNLSDARSESKMGLKTVSFKNVRISNLFWPFLWTSMTSPVIKVDRIIYGVNFTPSRKLLCFRLFFRRGEQLQAIPSRQPYEMPYPESFAPLRSTHSSRQASKCRPSERCFRRESLALPRWLSPPYRRPATFHRFRRVGLSHSRD